MDLIIVLVMVIVGILSTIWMATRALRGRMWAYRSALQERYPNARLILSNTNFMGRSDGGLVQVRGNGALVLNDEALIFVMWWPNRLIEIPLSQIQSTELVKSYRGKWVMQPLLKVNFVNPMGELASAAWWVKNPQEVQAILGK